MVEIQWAPLDIPLRRRLQTFTTFILTTIGAFSPILGQILMFYLLYTRFWWLMVLYIIYSFNDFQSVSNGKRCSQWFRNSFLFRHTADYFPMKLIKTADLDPSKNYLAMVYPHGQIMFGACIAFETNALNVNQVFPGIKTYLAHAYSRFTFPFLRDFTLLLGGVSSDESTLLYLLDKKHHTGNLVGLNTGGAAETMALKKGEYNIIIKNRRGYARIALKTGSSIVPVFSFGETRLFKGEAAPKGTFMRSVQNKITETVGIAPILPSGRGFFQYSFGMIPHREPVHVVVGAPIDVPKILEPTKEDIEKVHEQFLEAINKLFEEHKHKYEPNPDIKLNIL